MKRQYFKSGFFALVLSTLVFVSCNKEDNAVSDQEAIATANEEAISDNYYDDVYSEMDDAVTNLETVKYDNSTSSSSLKSASTTGTITITVDKPDTVQFPKTITILYNNYEDRAGRIKNGTITIVITGRYRETGSSKTLTFENFTIDSVKVEGVYSVANLGRNNDGYLQYSVQLQNGKLTFTDGSTIERTFERTRTWVAGEITPLFIWDDAYLIEGGASGKNRNGNTYVTEITNPLYIAAACPWIAKGTITIVTDTKTISIDYGSNSDVCDRFATMTINGVSHEVILPRGNKRY